MEEYKWDGGEARRRWRCTAADAQKSLINPSKCIGALWKVNDFESVSISASFDSINVCLSQSCHTISVSSRTASCGRRSNFPWFRFAIVTCAPSADTECSWASHPMMMMMIITILSVIDRHRNIILLYWFHLVRKIWMYYIAHTRPDQLMAGHTVRLMW